MICEHVRIAKQTDDPSNRPKIGSQLPNSDFLHPTAEDDINRTDHVNARAQRRQSQEKTEPIDQSMFAVPVSGKPQS